MFCLVGRGDGYDYRFLYGLILMKCIHGGARREVSRIAAKLECRIEFARNEKCIYFFSGAGIRINKQNHRWVC